MYTKVKNKFQAKQSLLRLCTFTILFAIIMYIAVAAALQAVGNSSIKNTRTSANYVTEQQMKLANPWIDMDESALYRVMCKAQNGQKVTIAFIGGSITKGTVSKGTKDDTFQNKLTYVDYFSNWWYEKFPKADLHFINAGIGATDSYLGVHRVQKDVLDQKPDLVVVEFAVNDEKTFYHKQSYENLVRKILAADSKPAVMLLFMSRLNGKNCQVQQSEIGKHYNLPMVSFANVIKDMVNHQIYTAEDLSGDGIHPSLLGYAVAGEILVKYLDGIWKKSPEQMISKSAPGSYVTSPKYSNAKLLTCKDIQIKNMGTFHTSKKSRIFKHNLTCQNGNGDLVFTVDCKNFGLLYAKQTDGKAGQFDIYVDDVKAKTINADFSKGKHRFPDAVPCYSSSVKKTHTIRIVKNPDSTGHELTIFGVLTSD